MPRKIRATIIASGARGSANERGPWERRAPLDQLPPPAGDPVVVDQKNSPFSRYSTIDTKLSDMIAAGDTRPELLAHVSLRNAVQLYTAKFHEIGRPGIDSLTLQVYNALREFFLAYDLGCSEGLQLEDALAFTNMLALSLDEGHNPLLDQDLVGPQGIMQATGYSKADPHTMVLEDATVKWVEDICAASHTFGRETDTI